MYPEMGIKNEQVLVLGTLSIIIPVFNQQANISHSLMRIKQVVERHFSKYELVVVNDGSTDDTLTTLKDIVSSDQQEHIRILSYTPNRGKGYAVRYGILHSHGDVVIFLDVDLDISPDLIKEYVEKLDSCDLVIASKRHPRSNVTLPASRLLMSRIFHLIVNVATGIRQTDTQAGLKVGRGEIMRTIFRNINIKRYAFDVELFMIASILDLRIQEMPVKMKIDRRFNAKEIVNMFIDVTRICYKYRIAHRYQREYLKADYSI
jgi:glycosyltransferase involved in cell wall biosynthesis